MSENFDNPPNRPESSCLRLLSLAVILTASLQLYLNSISAETSKEVKTDPTPTENVDNPNTQSNQVRLDQLKKGKLGNGNVSGGGSF